MYPSPEALAASLLRVQMDIDLLRIGLTKQHAMAVQDLLAQYEEDSVERSATEQ